METITQIAERVMRSLQANPRAPEVKAPCSKCNGDRWIRVDEDRKELPREYRGPCRVIACSCQVRERIAHRLPQKYREAKLSDFSANTIETVLEWFQSERPGLLLYGPAGTGKTHLAAAITRALLEVNQDAQFFETAQIYRNIRSCFNSEIPEEQLLADYTEVPWLTLDDFASGALTDFERRYALEILNGRINGSRRTIITTNLNPEAIGRDMDERIASRLLLFAQIQTAGRDRRAGA